ncbi:TonB-dependent receptor [Muricoccus radiodurans]|uniref:TonB-dependent receptor n=1 Tax=Muricoccus radiodurans TaxID=2231721 RepID=UPI003CEC6180
MLPVAARPLASAGLLAVLLPITSARAQSPVLTPDSGAGTAIALPELTVTATRAPRAIEDVPQTVQVIDRAEIERQITLSPSPADAIARLVPGYTVTNGTISGASEGFRGRDALVLLDGVPLNTPLRDVSRILALLDLNAVERIETVAGASSLYGAGATGGTINIITRRPTEDGVRVTANGAVRAFTANPGRSLSPELSLGLQGRTGPFDYSGVISGRGTGRAYDGNGREAPSDALLGQGGADRTETGNLFARFGYNLDGARRFEVTAMAIRLEQTPDYLTDYSGRVARPNFGRTYDAPSVRERTESFSARYTDSDFALGSLSLVGFYNNVDKRFNFSEFSFPANSVVYYSGNPNSPTSPANQTRLLSERYGVNITVDTRLDPLLGSFLPGSLFTWGGDIGRERTHQVLTSGQDVFTPLEQTTLAAFGQLQVPIGPVTFRGGIRYEHFALDVDDFTRPAAYTAQQVGTALRPFVLPPLRVTGGSFNYDAFTYNLGATIRVQEGTEIYGGFSQGFALPDVGSFTRRAGLSTAFACAVTTPNCLRPGTTVSYSSIGPDAQIVDSYELGIRHRGARFTAGLVGFISTSDQGVTFDPATNLISQQAEIIYGAELNGSYAVTPRFTLAGLVAYREGKYDSDSNGSRESSLPNNRIANPWRAVLSGTYRFEEGTTVRVEGIGFTGRNESINTAGQRYKIRAGATMNLAVGTPVLGGEVYGAVENLFDAAYQNPTATSVRNLPVEAYGRTVTIGYRRSF